MNDPVSQAGREEKHAVWRINEECSVLYYYANCLRDDIDQQCEGGLAPAPPLTPVSRGLPNKAVEGAAERLRYVGRQLTNTECKQFGRLVLEVLESSLCLINTLEPSGYYMYHKVSHSKILRVYVLCESQNKQRIFPYTKLTL